MGSLSLTNRLSLLLIILLHLHQSSVSGQPRHVPIGTKSVGTADMSLELVARIHGYTDTIVHPNDLYDRAIYSPKSVHIYNPSGNDTDSPVLFINNLEGGSTSVYKIATPPVSIGRIKHRFTAADSALFSIDSIPGYGFRPADSTPNVFTGRPVEMCMSHNGQLLWIPYYRRSFDTNAVYPSAVAVVDTRTQKVVTVLPAAPLPKMIAASPDNRYIAVTNWGDNSVHLINADTSLQPMFGYVKHFRVGSKPVLQFDSVTDRDKNCGNCLRGTTFTPDSRYLLVGRMGGGGIAVFDVGALRYLGTVFGTLGNVRHLVINGDFLYLSSNADGTIQRTKWRDLIEFVHKNRSGKPYTAWQSVHTGRGARTFCLTPDGKWLFATAFDESEVGIVRTADMKKTGKIATDSWPVGMSIDANGKWLAVTAQGKNGLGGNSVMLFAIHGQ